MSAYLLVRAEVEENSREGFDNWYQNEHLPSALKEFGKDQNNQLNIQRAFDHRAKMNGLSSTGKWSEALEKEAAA